MPGKAKADKGRAKAPPAKARSPSVMDAIDQLESGRRPKKRDPRSIVKPGDLDLGFIS